MSQDSEALSSKVASEHYLLSVAECKDGKDGLKSFFFKCRVAFEMFWACQEKPKATNKQTSDMRVLSTRTPVLPCGRASQGVAGSSSPWRSWAQSHPATS